MTEGTRKGVDVAAGVALVAAIPALYALKMIFGGWYAVILVLFVGPFALVAWAFAWVIAAQTFFSRRDAFRVTRASVRMRIAAWLHFVLAAGVGVLMSDGGDGPTPMPRSSAPSSVSRRTPRAR